MRFFIAATLCAAALSAQEKPSPAKIFDSQLTMIERELVPLVEAMPAEKIHYVPKQGAFSDSRTFAQQASHVAAVLYVVASGLMEEKNPSDPGKNENGPANLKTKEDVVKYVKEAFSYAHKAVGTLTNDNVLGLIKSPFGNNQTSRANVASILVWHSFDHYGQMCVYARLNDIIPPASRK
jgi:hypothetical protein